MAQSFAFAVFATLICQINNVFPCKDTKAAKSVAFCVILLVPNSWIICFGLWHRALVCGTELGFCTQIMAQSFGVWHRASFWHRNTLNLCNCRVPKLKNSACAEFLDSYAGFFWHRALSCDTELRFGIEIPLIYATAECQNLRIRLVPNSGDSLPVFALECFSANETGVLISEFSTS